jgi:hypothetical protein
MSAGRRAVTRAAVAAAAALLAGCPDPACELAWRAVVDDTGGALLAVQGSAADRVWAVGGGLGAGGARARRWDGRGWSELDLGGEPRTLWWVWPDGDDAAWMVGERGLVLRVVGDAITPIDAGTDATLYGVWGSGGEVWIVGDDDVVLRWDGRALAPVAAPARGATLFKVWGAAPDDVWVSGQRGTMLRWDGAGWTNHSAELDTLAAVLTVHGCGADEVYAVAGQALFRWNGAAWAARDDVAVTSAANGVACAGGEVLVVGNAGLKLRIDGDGVVDDRLDGPWDTDYHGAWIDPGGGAWAAGGNFNTPDPPLRRGVLAHRGCPAR